MLWGADLSFTLEKSDGLSCIPFILFTPKVLISLSVSLCLPHTKAQELGIEIWDSEKIKELCVAVDEQLKVIKKQILFTFYNVFI